MIRNQFIFCVSLHKIIYKMLVKFCALSIPVKCLDKTAKYWWFI